MAFPVSSHSRNKKKKFDLNKKRKANAKQILHNMHFKNNSYFKELKNDEIKDKKKEDFRCVE